MMHERTDTEWLHDLRGPQTDAALADLRGLLLRGLRYALAERAVAATDLEDFVQDALLKILQELPSYRGEARFTTWAQKVCVRVALTELRRRRWRDVSLDDLLAAPGGSPATPAVLTDQGPDPGQVAARRMILATLERLIAEELTERQQQAMLAVMQGGMPLQEVADRLGTSRNALYKLLHDARRRLQQRMLREGLAVADVLATFADS